MRLDRVDSVAVGADRGQAVAARNSLPVNALHEGLRDLGVALAAGGRNVEFINRRLLIVGGKNLVRAVAIRADRGLLRALFDGHAMHAGLIGHKALGALAVRFDEKLLPVAPAAGDGNVRVIHRRFGIVRRKDLVRAAVTVLAVCRCAVAGLVRLRVQAVRVSVLRIRMALGAGDLPRGGLMDQAPYILVAINARKHAAVDGVLELVLIHIQADLLAVHFRSHGRVGVAGETIAVLELVLGVCRAGPNKQG